MSGALQGKAVLITGGGTGIGTGCALAAAREGAAVTICGRTESTLAAAAERVSEAAADGGSVQHVIADVTSEDDVIAAIAAAASITGHLDGVVANAGGGGMIAPYHGQDTAEFRRVLDLNVVGTMLLLKHSVAHLAAAPGGSFIGMSSIAGHLTHPGFGAYTASKAAIEQIVRNGADEYGVAGVRCNAIRPGFIATEIMELIPRDSAVYESYLTNTPLHPLGEPEDVAELAVFLLSSKSRWITGAVINVDGGLHLRRGPDFSSFMPPFEVPAPE
jgi:NAD(P)-dependent dehydrogenase (short-subunit alcohol dehydrogenase family)